MDLGFRLIKKSKSRARVGELRMAHGVIQTPAFVPVGTQATVKGLTPDDLRTLGSQCVLANTYHLYLRPGAEVVAKMGDLHGFMNWKGPIFTDSGGFQVFSLGVGMEHEVGKVVDLFADDSREEVALNEKLKIKNDPFGKLRTSKLKVKEKTELMDTRSFCKVDDEGVTFMSHLDGTLHRWTAEKSMEVQDLLGADIVLAMDECTSPLHGYDYTKVSMERSHDWEDRSLKRFQEIQKGRKTRQLIYGIVQGGKYEDLRRESAQFVSSRDFNGVAIGGAMVSKRTMEEILDWVIPLLPEERPRHLLGIGEVDDIFMGVEAGIDTFDCAHPTRIARRGNLYISPENGSGKQNRWRINIGSQEYIEDKKSIDPGCDCYTCRNFSRGYLRHLYWARELTYYRLATIHNLRFVTRLMEEIRVAVETDRFEELKKEWIGNTQHVSHIT